MYLGLPAMMAGLRRVGTILAWCTTAGLVSYVLATTDFDGFLNAVRLASLPSFLTMAVLFNLSHLALDSAGVGVLLERTGLGIPFRRLVAIRAASYLLGFVNYNLGFVLLAAAAGHNRRVRWQSLVSPFLALNFIDFFIMGTVLTYGLTAGARAHLEAPATVLLPIAAAIAVVALPIILAASRLGTRNRATVLAGFLDTFRAIDARALVTVLLLRYALLMTDAAGDLLMLRTFNLNIPIGVFAQFFPVDSFACVLPITVAGIGPTLVLMRLFFAPYASGGTAPISAIDAFSVSATTVMILIRTALALGFMPFVLKIWKSGSGDTAHVNAD